MRRVLGASRVGWALGCWALAFGWIAVAGAEEPGSGVAIDVRGARAQASQIEPVAGGEGGIAVTFQPAEWSDAIVDNPEPGDWSRFGMLVVALENPGPRPIEFAIRLDDDPSADGSRHCRTARGTIAAGAAERFAVTFGPDPMDLGMRGLPGPEGVRALLAGGSGPFDRGHIVSFRLFVHRPKQPETLIIRSVRLEPPVDMSGIVDPFGQYAKAAWPGKLYDEAEFAQRRAAEESELAAAPTLPGRNRFGGWAEGPQLEATGNFRTVKLDGRWWLVDPDGRLFFSSGIDCVSTDASTIITGRESMFSWLPTEPPLNQFFGRFNRVHRGPVPSGRTYNFYLANLYRKYGPEYEAAFRDTALRRLPAWGFNTVGNWSDGKTARSGRVPYVATAGIGGDHARLSSGSDYWALMHDPFDPQFADDVESSLRGVAESTKGDPWCIGTFVDNELSWGRPDSQGRIGLGLGALAAAPESPARQALLADLREEYGDIRRLNTAWGTEFKDWAALESASYTPAEPYADALREDLRLFVARLARQYFKTVRDTLKQLDPDHLYLGCRFAWYTPEAIEAADEFCDVIGFNIYRRRVEPTEWPFLPDLKRPAIIGEFHVGALDRGMFHTGLVSSASQDERAAIFRDYVESVLDHPSFVGCHWFQYKDQPLTGRTLDGENYNIGFITGTDTPHPEMVAAARAVHRTMYQRRAQADLGTGSEKPGD